MDQRATERNAVALLRASVSGDAASVEAAHWSGETWVAVAEELRAQAVAAIPAGLAVGLCNDQSVSSLFFEEFGKAVKSWHSHMACESEVVSWFRDAGIPVAVLKGAAAAANYPDPTLRRMGDIDLIVAPGDFDRAFNLLVVHGFARIIEEGVNPRHEALAKEGFPEIELHRWFSLSPTDDTDAAVDRCVFSALEQVRYIDVAGYEAPMLPPLANGIVLIEHIRHHLCAGLGFRQVLDWLFFVERWADEEFMRAFEPLARECGLLTLTRVSTALCKRHLGLQREVPWCGDVDDQLVDDLLNYVVTCGNMGRKVEHGSASTKTVLKHLTGPKQALRYLSEGGLAHWKAARDHAILRPLAPLYQVGHLAKMGFARKATLADFVGEARTSRAEASLLERLNDRR